MDLILSIIWNAERFCCQYLLWKIFIFTSSVCLELNIWHLISIFELSALPAIFTKEMQNQTAIEGESIIFQCELSKPAVPVVWRKGTQVIHSGGKYLIKQVGATVELKITDVKPEDTGDYACDCGDSITTANVKVNGRRRPNPSLKCMITLALCSGSVNDSTVCYGDKAKERNLIVTCTLRTLCCLGLTCLENNCIICHSLNWQHFQPSSHKH